MAGVSCLWRAADYWRELHGLPEALPAALAERLRPARHKAMQRVPSVQAAAAAAAGSDEEGGGRDEEAEEDYDPEEEEEEMRGEVEVHSDFDSDDGGWVGGLAGGGEGQQCEGPGCVAGCGGRASRARRVPRPAAWLPPGRLRPTGRAAAPCLPAQSSGQASPTTTVSG